MTAHADSGRPARLLDPEDLELGRVLDPILVGLDLRRVVLLLVLDGGLVGRGRPRRLRRV